MAKKRKVLALKGRDNLTNYVYEDIMDTLYDCGVLVTVMAVLKDIDNGIPVEEIQTTLEDIRKEWTVKLMKTDFGRDHLEGLNSELGFLETENKEEQKNA